MLSKLLQRFLPVVEATRGESYICILSKAEKTLLIGLSAGVSKSFVRCCTH